MGLWQIDGWDARVDGTSTRTSSSPSGWRGDWRVSGMIFDYPLIVLFTSLLSVRVNYVMYQLKS